MFCGLWLSNRRSVSNNSSPVFVPPCSNVMLRYRCRSKWAAALGCLWRVRIPFLFPTTLVVPSRSKLRWVEFVTVMRINAPTWTLKIKIDVPGVYQVIYCTLILTPYDFIGWVQGSGRGRPKGCQLYRLFILSHLLSNLTILFSYWVPLQYFLESQG